MPRRPSFRERLLSKLEIDPSSGCLLWQGTQDKDGYGQIKCDGRMLRVHRVMFEMFSGPIPPGLEPDHLCRVRRCAAPAHLELVTHKENMLRGAGVGSMNAAKTRCDNGHLLTGRNLITCKSGARKCRECAYAAIRRYKARKRAARRAERRAERQPG